MSNDTPAHHQGNLLHDALGGAVGFELAKLWEDHVAKNGQPTSHAKAKEVLAALTGAAITRLAETKGRDAWDAHKAAQAQKHADEHADVLAAQYTQTQVTEITQ